jgi:murein DD-endopeptidase MepM/ murein hydrolase activator NlpD
MFWPLKDCFPLFPDEPGRFGSVRSADIHTGVDLYCELGTEVVAIEDGEVVLVEGFTGPNADDPSPWWNDTSAILVEGDSGVIVYGEVTSLVSEGDRVKAGQVIARVDTPVLKSFKGRPMVMLHIELMKQGSRETLWWRLGEKKDDSLLDPEPLLLDIVPKVGIFNLSDYDGNSFCDPTAKRKDSKWWSYWGGNP